MAITILLRRGTASNRATYSGLVGELLYSTNTQEVHAVETAITHHRLSMDKDWTANTFRRDSGAGSAPGNISRQSFLLALSASAGAPFDFGDQSVKNVPIATLGTHPMRKDTVDAFAEGGVTWIESVLDVRSEPYPDPTNGDRYYVQETPTGIFVGHANHLATYDNSTWTYTLIAEGSAFYAQGGAFFYVLDTDGGIAKMALGMGNHAGIHVSTDPIRDAEGTGGADQNGLMTIDFAGKLDGIDELAEVTNPTTVTAALANMESDYAAHSLMIAVSDNIPISLNISAQQVMGRLAGNITNLTGTNLWTMLTTAPGAALHMNSKKLTNLVDPDGTGLQDQYIATRQYVLDSISDNADFTDFADTPGTPTVPGWAGNRAKLVAVNGTETGLEYLAILDGGGFTY